MTHAQIDVHPGAREDYLDCVRWYLQHSQRIAQRFVQAFERASRGIAQAPDRAAADGDGIRWVRLRRFPHLIYYRVQSTETVVILAVAHASRSPGYWRDRI